MMDEPFVGQVTLGDACILNTTVVHYRSVVRYYKLVQVGSHALNYQLAYMTNLCPPQVVLCTADNLCGLSPKPRP